MQIKKDNSIIRDYNTSKLKGLKKIYLFSDEVE